MNLVNAYPHPNFRVHFNIIFPSAPRAFKHSVGLLLLCVVLCAKYHLLDWNDMLHQIVMLLASSVRTLYTGLDPRTFRNRRMITWMLSAHGVCSYFDEWLIMQIRYRNLCFIYFSPCTEFNILNCKWNMKLVTGKIMCLRQGDGILLHKSLNRRFNSFAKTHR